MNSQTKSTLVALLGLLAGTLPAPAQWVTQNFALKAGWNAVYLHVDASYATLQELVGSVATNQISEVWMWNPVSSTMQLPADTDAPLVEGGQWMSWNRANDSGSLLQRLVGNAAYLVRVYSNVATFAWSVKGKPVAPSYQWTTAGINLVGFPTAPTNPPSFYDFLAKSPELFSNAQIFQYPGGELTSGNPAEVSVNAWRTNLVRRGQAYWLCKTNYYNKYYGPVDVDLSSQGGIEFGSGFSVRSFRLRNMTATNVTVTMTIAASETPPAGQAAISIVPPLLVRGGANATNPLVYDCSALAPGTPRTYALAAKGAAGSEVEVVLGLNRAAMTGPVSNFQAGVLSVTDSFGQTKIDVPVSASVSSSAGLWVGGAAITQVGQYLKSYTLGVNGDPVPVGSNGTYEVTGINTNLGVVPTAHPLRLIVHNPVAGNAVLLQRAFCGVDANTNNAVSTAEASLNRNFLKSARRISAAHLPWSSNNAPWAFSGNLDAASLTTTVATAYDDQASNPFVHAYHPDHDNLDADFSTKLGAGVESYAIRRDITLTPTPPPGDFDSLVSKSKTISGGYAETITVGSRTFQVRGAFLLNRVTDVPILTVP